MNFMNKTLLFCAYVCVFPERGFYVFFVDSVTANWFWQQSNTENQCLSACDLSRETVELHMLITLVYKLKWKNFASFGS